MTDDATISEPIDYVPVNLWLWVALGLVALATVFFIASVIVYQIGTARRRRGTSPSVINIFIQGLLVLVSGVLAGAILFTADAVMRQHAYAAQISEAVGEDVDRMSAAEMSAPLMPIDPDAPAFHLGATVIVDDGDSVVVAQLTWDGEQLLAEKRALNLAGE